MVAPVNRAWPASLGAFAAAVAGLVVAALWRRNRRANGNRDAGRTFRASEAIVWFVVARDRRRQAAAPIAGNRTLPAGAVAGLNDVMRSPDGDLAGRVRCNHWQRTIVIAVISNTW
jgi:hypothetical protein